jgi:hypothetical protein
MGTPTPYKRVESMTMLSVVKILADVPEELNQLISHTKHSQNRVFIVLNKELAFTIITSDFPKALPNRAFLPKGTVVLGTSITMSSLYETIFFSIPLITRDLLRANPSVVSMLTTASLGPA